MKETEKLKTTIELMKTKNSELANFLEEERLIRGEVIESLQKNVANLTLKLKEVSGQQGTMNGK